MSLSGLSCLLLCFPYPSHTPTNILPHPHPSKRLSFSFTLAYTFIYGIKESQRTKMTSLIQSMSSRLDINFLLLFLDVCATAKKTYRKKYLNGATGDNDDEYEWGEEYFFSFIPDIFLYVINKGKGWTFIVREFMIIIMNRMILWYYKCLSVFYPWTNKKLLFFDFNFFISTFFFGFKTKTRFFFTIYDEKVNW